MIKHYFGDPEIDYSDEDCVEKILVLIKILEQEGVTLTFDPDLFVKIPLLDLNFQDNCKYNLNF